MDAREIVVVCPECKVKLPTEHVYVYVEEGELYIEVTSKCLHPKEGCTVDQNKWEWLPLTLRLKASQIMESLGG